ncbi:MAG: hypothetical protein H8E44_38495 [Planctomycetes bacterium]|nr:hypothetical protein [Planctomycetota bacterium]MBL7039182.1 hypothetical protein [Pirellulaceae bacterium]
MRCPRCGSTHLRKTTAGQRKLSSVIRLVVVPVRCYMCGHLFHRPTAMTDDLRSEPAYHRYRRVA